MYSGINNPAVPIYAGRTEKKELERRVIVIYARVVLEISFVGM